MSDTEKYIGNQIRAKRMILGLSQRQLADLLAAHGVIVSAGTIGGWERADRSISAVQLAAVCKVLDCLPSTLMGLQDSGSEELSYLNKRKLQILEYASGDWDGDKHALWEFCLLYMSLPPMARGDVSGMGIHQYMRCLADGSIDPAAPAPDLDYIEKAWNNLFTKKHSGYI